MRTSRIAAVILAVGLVLVPPIAAQSADSGRVQVTVHEAMGMLGGFRVQSSETIALTDAAGRAVLTLATGRQVVTVAHVGFKPARATVIIVRDSTVTLTFTMAMNEMAMELADVKISATRTERLAGETPIRVEVVDEMEVDEKTLMSPSGIGMLLNETPGLRVQATAPGLGIGSVRILGLPGNYTVMLADGLPLYGGSSSALGPLDISPVDLQRVESIKGAASSLYGAQALGGVINLVSKPPTGKNEILLNRRTLGVTDAATWLSRRFGTGTGLSLLAAGTVQSPVDVDRDGWADQAKAERWNVRPRLTAVDARGRSLFVTAGYGYDNRVGGTLNGAVAPDGLPFREALQSRRADVGATAQVPLQGSGSLSLRFAYANSSRRRDFGPGESENDGTSTGLLELTRSFESGTHITVVGSALQLDQYTNAVNNAFDHSWYTPGLFATTERDAGPVTISASARRRTSGCWGPDNRTTCRAHEAGRGLVGSRERGHGVRSRECNDRGDRSDRPSRDPVRRGASTREECQCDARPEWRTRRRRTTRHALRIANRGGRAHGGAAGVRRGRNAAQCECRHPNRRGRGAGRLAIFRWQVHRDVWVLER